jgi:hypothetical protein
MDVKLGLSQIEGILEQDAEENILTKGGDWRKLYTVMRMFIIFTSPNLNGMIQSRRMTLVGT